MATPGSSVNHWRIINHLRQYLRVLNRITTVSSLRMGNQPVDTHDTKLTKATSNSNLNDDLPGSPPKKIKEVNEEISAVDSESKSQTLVESANLIPQKTSSDVLVAEDTISEPIPEKQSELQKVWLNMNSYLPQMGLGFLQTDDSGKPPIPSPPKWASGNQDIMSKTNLDIRTRHLVTSLNDAVCDRSKLRRLENLCSHLRQFPKAKGMAVKSQGIHKVNLLIKRTKDEAVASMAREALALMGHTGPVSARGIRMLAIDGGGIRGLVAVNILKKIEQITQQPIHQLFDFICGTSTGAVLAVLIGIHHAPLDQCESLYRKLSEQIFTQTTLKGATGLFKRNSYYDSEAWTQILKENMGEKSLIETARAKESPKMCLVSTLANTKSIQAFLFRNYNLPYRVTGHYPGSSLPRIWEAVRASAAAPGYFSEFPLGDMILLDGGVFVNNPTAIAIHEAKQLWANTSMQCVVSVGTGRHEPVDATSEPTMSWKTRFRTIVNSATDTEAVHTVMHDLLPGNVYFRFNPYLTDEVGLSEIGHERLALMIDDTAQYVRKNEAKIKEAALALMVGKTRMDRAKDWYREQSGSVHGTRF